MTLRRMVRASRNINAYGLGFVALVACSGNAAQPSSSGGPVAPDAPAGSTTTAGKAGSVPTTGSSTSSATTGAAAAAGRPSAAGGSNSKAATDGAGGMVAPAAANPSATAATSAGAQATAAMAGSPSASSAGKGATGAAGAMAAATVDVACNPSDKKPEATPTTAAALQATGMPATGKFDVVVEVDPGIVATIWRPEPIGKDESKHPILVWGMGACSNDSTSSGGVFSEMLREMASHGILVIADATVGGTGAVSTNGSAQGLLKAIDWAVAENERPCSKYYHKLNTKKIATSGQSCGGMNAISAATDPRVTVAIPFNSGLFSRDTSLYMKLHTPMAIVDSGPDDIAYANGKADFEAINNIPIMFANYEFNSSFAHNAGFTNQDNSGVFGVLAIAWLNWWLYDDMGPTGKGYFVGDQCGVCSTKWDIMWKMKPM